MTYTVTQWGRVYRSCGPTTGIKGKVAGLSYRDVCDQIVNASRRDEWVDIADEQGNRVSLGHFLLD